MPDNIRRPRLLAILSVLALLLVDGLAGAQPVTREPLQVMSFNIRYGTAKDGDNHWSARREMLFDVIRERDADLVGLQEALAFQIDEIQAAVPGYAVVGVGRDDGGRAGELSAILFKVGRFRVADAGTFWFSDTPEVPASKSWGNNITRICTWARLIDRDGRGFYHFNLHLDHESQPSRERSTALLRQRIEARAFPADPVVVTGDFNVGDATPRWRPSSRKETRPPHSPTLGVLHPVETAVGTFPAPRWTTSPPHTSGETIDASWCGRARR